ncbi:hypothetical protein N2152v2_005527 [Parachlorella kessleri]
MQIDQWGNQQSRWDLLVQLADRAVAALLDGIDSIPTTPKPPTEWGSDNPRKDLKAVAAAVCSEVASLQPYAKEEYGVDISLTKMTSCRVATPHISAFSVDPVYAGPLAAAPAPGPAPSRRLLAV